MTTGPDRSKTNIQNNAQLEHVLRLALVVGYMIKFDVKTIYEYDQCLSILGVRPERHHDNHDTPSNIVSKRMIDTNWRTLGTETLLCVSLTLPDFVCCFHSTLSTLNNYE